MKMEVTVKMDVEVAEKGHSNPAGTRLPCEVTIGDSE